MKKKILDNASFVVGLLTVLAVFLCKDSLTNAAIVGSIGVILYGLVNCFNANRLGILFMSIGCSLITAMSLYKYDVLPKFESITFFICMSMAIMVVVAAIFELFNIKSMNKKYSLKVDAKVVDLVKNPNTKKEYYQPVYEYVIGKDVFTVGLPGFLDKNLPKIGDVIKLNVNPEDKEDVYFTKRKEDNIHMVAVGLFFLIVSVLIIISLF